MSESILGIKRLYIGGVGAVDPASLHATQALTEYLDAAAQFIYDNFEDSQSMVDQLMSVVLCAGVKEATGELKPYEQPHDSWPKTFEELLDWAEEEVARVTNVSDEFMGLRGRYYGEGENQEGHDCLADGFDEDVVGATAPEPDPLDLLYHADAKLATAGKLIALAPKTQNKELRRDARDAADVLLRDAIMLANSAGRRVVAVDPAEED